MSRLLAGFLAATMACPVWASPWSGRSVYLEDANGGRIHVADLTGSDQTYTVAMRSGPFTDQFLSMRPFKCIKGPDKMWCHVPYPYPIRRDTAEGLTDLEYDFLFVWKGRTDYGIDMWNGVYYVLEPQGDGYVGHLHELNMDILAVPPDAGQMRPIRATDLEPGDPDSHWLPRLVIE